MYIWVLHAIKLVLDVRRELKRYHGTQTFGFDRRRPWMAVSRAINAPLHDAE